ncbi:helix-turn-helix domain-containing protein [bacterium]|nr:helix-turn-helix domain-containing protein [bacterium]
MITKYKLKGRSKDSYMECLAKFLPLTSIKNGEHLADASNVVDALISMDRDSGENEYLDALTDLIEAYEDRNVEIDESTPSEMLLHLIQARGITQTALARDAGVSKSTVSEILSGKDRMSKRIAFRLAEYFSVDAVLFLRDDS